MITIPRNEAEVLYLFSRKHEELGFEEIISFQQFPDVYALRNGKKVGIEIELKASNFVYHFADYSGSPIDGQGSHAGKRKFGDVKVDLIICWINDKPIPYPVEVMELAARLSSKID